MRRNPLTLVFHSPEEAVEFLSAVEKMAGNNVSGELKMNKVKIYIHAQGQRYTDIVRRIRALYSTFSRRSVPGLRRYSLQTIFSIAEIKTPIPPCLLAELLKLRGYKAFSTGGGVIETDADIQVLKEYVEKLSKAYEELLRIPASTQARRAVALLAVYWDVSVDEALRRLVEKGLLAEGERLIPLHNFEKIVEAAVSSGE